MKPKSNHPKGRTLALIVVLLGFFIDLLDTTIVNIAVPSIQLHLGATYAAVQWVIAGYALVFAMLLIIGGRLGDIFGYKKMFLLGVAGFTIASALSGSATSPAMLIIGRLLQGGMAAIMVPQVLSIIQVLYKPAERAGVSAFYAGLGGIASMGGPILGGVLISNNVLGLGWRSVFFINVPVGIIALILGAKVLPNAKSPHPLKVDVVGAGLITAAMLALIYPLLEGRDLGWPLWTYLMIAASLPLFLAFGWYERRKDRKDGSPLVVPMLFRIRSYIASLSVSMAFFAAMSSFFLILTLLLQLGLGYSPLRAGLVGLPFAFGVGITAGVTGNALLPKFGRKVIAAGILTMALGIALFALVMHHFGPGIKTWQFIGPLFIGGAGMGMVVSSFFAFALSEVPVHAAGSASGVLSAVQQVAGSIGIALIGVVFFGGLTTHAQTSIANQLQQTQQQLTAAHVPASAQKPILAQMQACFSDRSREKDPAVIPVSCKQPTGAQQNQTVGKILGAAATQANAHNFIDAFTKGSFYAVGALILSSFLTIFLPKRLSQKEIDSQMAL